MEDPSPCFNPNTDNENYDPTVSEDDERECNDRWLLVWQSFAACAKRSGGCMIQLVDPQRGQRLSPMQLAEQNIASMLQLEVIAMPLVEESV